MTALIVQRMTTNSCSLEHNSSFRILFWMDTRVEQDRR
jgi:hypothetical protein